MNWFQRNYQRWIRFFKRKSRYRCLELIGVGGLAQVFTSFDTQLNRVVAIKKLNPENHTDATKLKGFINESKLISYLDHPGIVPVYDTFVDSDEQICYTMKFIEGEDLHAFISRQSGEQYADLATLLPIFSKICETLAFAHDKGVLHLDLKPENIRIGQYGEVRVMDWGNARLFNLTHYRLYLRSFMSEDQLETLEEKENFLAGTPEYMSPEQTLLPRDQLTPASDIFAIGVILYQMLTKILPFTEDNLEVLFELIRNYHPRPPYEINPTIPRRLSQICMKMLAKEVGQRYSSFREILADIQDLTTSGQGLIQKKYETGEMIFREGDSGEYAFVIISGLVEISKGIEGTRQVLAQLGKGEFVGEIAIFTKQPRIASARALQPTVIQLMNKGALEEELEKLNPWLEQMIARLSTRFVSLTEKVLFLEQQLQKKS
ncbi:MAG: cyclic nucleotide-binding domain-containing protein [Planctomycetota bacterium]